MSFRASHRYARISARKVRPLADLIRGKFADEALDILRYQPQRGARLLEKVLRSALGNAQDPDQNSGRAIDVERLVVVETLGRLGDTATEGGDGRDAVEVLLDRLAKVDVSTQPTESP